METAVLKFMHVIRDLCIHSLTHKEYKIFLLPFPIRRELFFGFQLGTVIAPRLPRRNFSGVKQIKFKAKFYFLGPNA